MTRTTLRRALASLAVLLVALTGCSGDPEPRMADPSPTSPSSSQVGDDEPPDFPAEANANTVAGAEAFVEFYLDTTNYAQATGDTAGLGDLARDDCRPCTNAAGFVNDTYAANGTIEGGATSLEVGETIPFKSGSDQGFQIRGKLTNERQVVDLPGREDDEVYAESTVSAQFVTVWTEAGWRIVFWDIS